MKKRREFAMANEINSWDKVVFADSTTFQLVLIIFKFAMIIFK